MKKLFLLFSLYFILQPAFADILIENAYIPAAPPSSKALAGYMTITNDGSESRTIVGIKSPAFAMVHLHQTMVKDGVSSMKALYHLKLKPGESVTLAPGGMHLMLMRPEEDLLASGNIPVTVKFKNGESVELVVPIRAIN